DGIAIHVHYMSQNLKPHIYMRTRELDLLHAMVASSQCYSLVNIRRSNMYTVNGHKLCRVFIKEQVPTLYVGFAMIKNMRKTFIIDSFIACLCRYIEEYQISNIQKR
ncbi:MAG: hypothetical protein AAF403_03845, partial [Pseudomonadota bacterium]